MSRPEEVSYRESVVTPPGTVYFDRDKTSNPALAELVQPLDYVGMGSITGDLHIGLYGVTVMQPDGSQMMVPWRVVQCVKMEKPV